MRIIRYIGNDAICKAFSKQTGITWTTGMTSTVLDDKVAAEMLKHPTVFVDASNAPDPVSAQAAAIAAVEENAAFVKRNSVGAVTGLVTAGGENPLASIYRASTSTETVYSGWGQHEHLFSVEETDASTVYWPWVIETSRIQNPLGRFYMYFSTDHDAGVGGIYLAHAEHINGPWNHVGSVYVDLAGTQTETPSVVWDEDVQKFRMYYQQNSAKYGVSDSISAVGVQSTLSATSEDGIVWVKDPNFVVQIPSVTQVHGDGHTGYFNPFMSKNGLCAFSLYGGGNGADFVLWSAETPAKFTTNQSSLGYCAHKTYGMSYKRVEWNHSTVIESNGIEYLVGLITDGVSGASAKNARVFIAKINRTYSEILEPPKIIWSPMETWESNDIRSLCPLIYDGSIYLFYTIGKTEVGVFSHVL